MLATFSCAAGPSSATTASIIWKELCSWMPNKLVQCTVTGTHTWGCLFLWYLIKHTCLCPVEDCPASPFAALHWSPSYIVPGYSGTSWTAWRPSWEFVVKGGIDRHLLSFPLTKASSSYQKQVAVIVKLRVWMGPLLSHKTPLPCWTLDWAAIIKWST